MTKEVGSAIQKATAQKTQVAPSKPNTVAGIISNYLDGENLRKRFDELLGKRAPQFISSLVTLVNADVNLQKALNDAPMTVIGAALRAASYDLPIDTGFGYAYIIPFKNKKKLADGTEKYINEASFIIGYKGMVQLCIRSGVYERIPDAVDVREGELISYDRLKGDAVFKWEEDEKKRENLPIVGYAGYFRLLSGAEKTVYMSKKEIDLHEKKHRKGNYMSKGWRDDWDAMAKKTVLRRMIGHYGLMSIDYRNATDERSLAIAEQIASGNLDDEDLTPPAYEVDFESGEVAVLDEQTETK